MPNPYFRFRQFTVYHDRTAMKVTTDACLFGAWCAAEMKGMNVKTALDVGTGTGLLSLMIAQKSEVRIDAVELDFDAAEQAKENVDHSPWQERICVHHTDIKNYEASTLYDCIFSNPPFYENEIESIRPEKNMAHHSGGLRLNELLTLIRKLLHHNGTFFLLLPYKRLEEIKRELQKNGLHLYQLIRVQQTPKHIPFRLMLMGKAMPAPEKRESTIIICNEQQQYSAQFTALLKDYYLYL